MADASASSPWTPTRAEGLRRLNAFLPRAGRAYADSRNFDEGPGKHSHVSTLSPYLRHRLVREEEVIGEVLERYSLAQAEKFVQEVCWRTYWKGWLELRPGVWRSYRSDVVDLLAELERDRRLRDRWEAAISGRSGIECLDHWADELISTGYLHNHARMWFASLWIFTLRLPWALGADFFLRHLLDGDPASNTLSWRWVAGLQTQGKTYLASAGNIARFTSGRFRPTERFTTTAEPIPGPPPPRPRPLPPADRPGQGPVGLLVTEDDLDPTTLGLDPDQVVALAGIVNLDDRSPMPVGPLPRAFTHGAMDDALDRAARVFDAPTDRLDPIGDWLEPVLNWAKRHGIDRIVTAESPQGPARERVDALREPLREAGITLAVLRKEWDDAFWPFATAGFFRFKSEIPEVLDRLGLMTLR
ncbi:FAD-binding domain-containing protein [Tautonia rosea]|uniref:FAD-binding domain-containing protein n=1 Tax=Tautonia rosea TaxID=2728037 RepID=UPI001473EA14|nr:FAD-binding domain-containing protein [Tautonia rosea]